jgi:uncharacterized protein (DUF697 family)
MPRNPLNEEPDLQTPDVDNVVGGATEQSSHFKESGSAETNQPQPSSASSPFQQARRVLNKRVLAASGMGMIPSPALDLAAITIIQLELIKSLAEIYQVPFRRDWGKSVLAGLTAGAAPLIVAPALGSLLKMIPVIGLPAGALSVSGAGAAMTYAVGRVFIMHFESGGTLLDFDPRSMRKYFRDEFANAHQAESKET